MEHIFNEISVEGKHIFGLVLLCLVCCHKLREMENGNGEERVGEDIKKEV